MKLLITIIILLQFREYAIARNMNSAVSAFQNNQNALNKVWIGPGGEYLEIRNDSAFFSNTFFYGLKYKLRFDNNMLDLISYQTNTFTIIKLGKDTLILKAADNNALGIVKTKEPVVFVDRNILYDPSFSFQKIYFERSGSGLISADYSNIQFEIDSSGSMLFSCIPMEGKYKGTYRGLLSPAQYERLNELIKRSAIERFAIPQEKLSDAPWYKFKFYYKNKMKEAYGQGIPYLAKDLVSFFESLSNEVHLGKISDKFGLKK